jgi:NAD(P)-dependent dehydrogenase (short-subunit alcohol dehydrogenase family)
LADLGGEALFLQADVSQAAQVEAMVKSTVQRFGRLDCAFNNAATLEVGSFQRLADFSEQEFDQHLALNLKSVWLCMKFQIQHMLTQDTGGAIVNTSSVNGLGGVAQGGLYAAAKAGVLGLTKSAALEYASHNIRVNAIVAGGFRTAMLEGVFAQMSGGDPEAAAAIESQISHMVPLGRIGRPEEAAEAVLWLCSPSASYMTGNSLIVDGGFTAPYR